MRCHYIPELNTTNDVHQITFKNVNNLLNFEFWSCKVPTFTVANALA